MAKEWDKFQADYNKLKPDVKAHSKTAFDGALQRATLAGTQVEEGEYNLAESTVTARANGVTGKALGDFMNDSTFAEAKKLLDVAVRDLVKRMKEFDTFCDGCESTADKLGDLHIKIEKDLKSRKDSSASKKDIIALRDTIYDEYQELRKLGAARSKLAKRFRSVVPNYQKTITDILNTSPEEQKRKKDQTELPQLVVDRNLKKNTSKAEALAKEVQAACKAALEAAEGGLDKAAAPLKEAQTALVALKKIADSYAEVEKEFALDIANSKDKGTIEKSIERIKKALENAARAFKGVSTTIKKAG